MKLLFKTIEQLMLNNNATSKNETQTLITQVLAQLELFAEGRKDDNDIKFKTTSGKNNTILFTYRTFKFEISTHEQNIQLKISADNKASFSLDNEFTHTITGCENLNSWEQIYQSLKSAIYAEWKKSANECSVIPKHNGPQIQRKNTLATIMYGGFCNGHSEVFEVKNNLVTGKANIYEQIRLLDLAFDGKDNKPYLFVKTLNKPFYELQNDGHFVANIKKVTQEGETMYSIFSRSEWRTYRITQTSNNEGIDQEVQELKCINSNYKPQKGSFETNALNAWLYAQHVPERVIDCSTLN